MPKPNISLSELLRAAGFRRGDQTLSPDQLREAEELVQQAADDPHKLAIDVLRQRQQSQRAAEAAGKLEQILKKLLQGDSILCSMERLHPGGASSRALCRVSGQLRELSIHPDVDVDELAQLKPWEYVRVDPKEMVIVGICRDPGMFDLAQGEVVDFKGYHDPERGLVRVQRQGQEEEIVALSPALCAQSLSPPAKLVLLRGDGRWAIATVRAEHAQSRFEVPIDGIPTRLEDLAGLDAVVEPFLEDVVLRLVRPEIRDEFDLRPLRGALLYSYRPGMGKTALLRAIAVWLSELGEKLGFDVVLYVVKPNELKIVWHGGDAKLVREELCGSILARQAQPRARPLLQLVVLDEIDSLGKRSGGDDATAYTSPAQNDAVQALLAEMDGMVQQAPAGDKPPAHVLWVGLTNRPDMLDEALKRPGRFGDLVLEVPSTTIESAEGVMAVYARGSALPWYADDEVRSGLSDEEIRRRFLRPALALVFDSVLLRYATDSQRAVEVTAGELMASVHYMEALNLAKKKAARRRLLDVGVPAISFDDIVEGLLEQAASAARQMDADRQMLRRQLRLKVPVHRVDLVPEEELTAHRFLRHPAA